MIESRKRLSEDVAIHCSVLAHMCFRTNQEGIRVNGSLLQLPVGPQCINLAS